MNATITSLASKNGPSERPKFVPMGAADTGAARAKILIVEDEWLVALDIEATLSRADYEIVAIAGSAEEAIEMVARHNPDLILMDIRLNGPRDGIDAAIEIARRFGVRCLFASANIDAAARERAQAANPVGWLSKPFSAQQLLEAVRLAGKG